MPGVVITRDRYARQLLFVSVGGGCFLVQFGILTALAAAGVERPLANAVGFIVSAQLNFALSSLLTWNDRPADRTRTVCARLASYNCAALLSLAVNTAVFTLSYHRVGSLLAAGLGVGCGMCVTYLVCDLLVFRDRRKRAHRGRRSRWTLASYAPAHRMQASVASSAQVVATMGAAALPWAAPPLFPTVIDPLLPAGGVPSDSVSIVMPAYREEENLADTVADFLEVPASLGIPHCVVIVNDGSTDRTGEIAERLAAQNPGRVIAVHHEVNRGYGEAVSTGIATALTLDCRWIFLTDSDGQFKARQLPAFLDTARRERADVIVGFRPRRADPLHRRINAFLWTTASRILLPVRVRDVDCAYKLIDRWCLEGMVLKGGAATISPELLAKMRVRKARIIERPVDHFPRLHGEQTGAKLSVIIRSLILLIALSANIAAERVSSRRSPRWRLPVRTCQIRPACSSRESRPEEGR